MHIIYLVYYVHAHLYIYYIQNITYILHIALHTTITCPHHIYTYLDIIYTTHYNTFSLFLYIYNKIQT